MEAREILTRFKEGKITIEEAEHYFRQEPFEEMEEYAKLDLHREVRSGFPEVIYSSGKADDHFVHIFQKLYEKNGEVMGTRASLCRGWSMMNCPISSRRKKRKKST